MWVDGNHTQALQDWRAWRPHLKRGARVAFHDCHPLYASPFTHVRDTVSLILREEKISHLEQVHTLTSFVVE